MEITDCYRHENQKSVVNVCVCSGGGAWTQTRRNQRTTSEQVGGVSGPRGASEEPREDQRARVQRGKTVNAATVYFLSGRHT